MSTEGIGTEGSEGNEVNTGLQKAAKDTKGFSSEQIAGERELFPHVRKNRLFGMGWLFGVIDGLEIPGYSVVMTPETFVQALGANGVPHFVVQTPGGWLLHPMMCKAEFRSEGNPDGGYVNTQIGLYVPRPE